MLKEKQKAPAFALKDQNDKTHRLADYKGKWVLIYFYPKDNTPGCTKEACTLRDSWAELKKLGVVVLGVSKDSVKSHEKFAKLFKLPFPILSDESTEMIEKYGAWQKKKFMGREYTGIARISYLLDPVGKVAKAYLKVKPAEHAGEVLAGVAQLSQKIK